MYVHKFNFWYHKVFTYFIVIPDTAASKTSLSIIYLLLNTYFYSLKPYFPPALIADPPKNVALPTPFDRYIGIYAGKESYANTL